MNRASKIFKKNKTTAKIINDMVIGKKDLKIRYKDVHSKLSNRRVTPLVVLLSAGGSWSILAYCHEQRDFRRFDLKRIQAMDPVPLSKAPRRVLHWPTEDYAGGVLMGATLRNSYRRGYLQAQHELKPSPLLERALERAERESKTTPAQRRNRYKRG